MGQNQEGSLRNKSQNILLSTIFFSKTFFFFYCVWLLMEINAEDPSADMENKTMEIIGSALLSTEHEYKLVGNQAKTSNGRFVSCSSDSPVILERPC